MKNVCYFLLPIKERNNVRGIAMACPLRFVLAAISAIVATVLIFRSRASIQVSFGCIPTFIWGMLDVVVELGQCAQTSLLSLEWWECEAKE